jgi:two-component system, sensor histidine kinase PdtaS
VFWRLFFLLLISSPALSQHDPGDLKKSLAYYQEQNIHDSISYYYRLLAYQYLTDQKYDSARYYLKYGFEYSANDPAAFALCLHYMGVLNYNIGNLDSTIYYYNAAYKHYQESQDTTSLVALELNLGIVYKVKGLYEKSLEYLLSASRKLEREGPSANLAACYNTLGTVSSKLGEPHVALAYHAKSIDIKRKIHDGKGLAASFNNLGNVYLNLEQYDSALTNFRRSLELKRLHNDKAAMGATLSNIGEIMVKQGRLEEAKSYFDQSLSVRLSFKDKVGEAGIRARLANIYLMTGDIKAADRELRLSEKVSKDLGLLEQLKSVYEIRVRLYEKTGEYKKALQSSQQLLAVKDSILNKDKAQSLAEMQTRYESMKKEDRIALLEKEGLLQAVELERRQIWIKSLVLAIVLTLIIGVLIYYNLRTVRKNKVHIELLLKELHHRVKNNLQILSSLLSLQSQQLTDDTAIKAVKSSESRINAMALIHRKLYTVDQNRTVDIKEYITELIEYLVYSYGYHERNFRLDLDIRDIHIDVDKAIPLGLILNELISNAFKHAYQNEPNPHLVVNLAYPEMNKLDICIQDNGAGMPAVDERQRKTFGMKIVSTLIKELKGSLNVETQNGTTYHLHIPI